MEAGRWTAAELNLTDGYDHTMDGRLLERVDEVYGSHLWNCACARSPGVPTLMLLTHPPTRPPSSGITVLAFCLVETSQSSYGIERATQNEFRTISWLASPPLASHPLPPLSSTHLLRAMAMARSLEPIHRRCKRRDNRVRTGERDRQLGQPRDRGDRYWGARVGPPRHCGPGSGGGPVHHGCAVCVGLASRRRRRCCDRAVTVL